MNAESGRVKNDNLVTAGTVASTSNIKKPNLFSATQNDKQSNTKQSPKNQILKGVIFALSGFVNPERTEIRDKGLKLGAKYRPDWTDECTHLMFKSFLNPYSHV
jgi:DNA-repair protein XRCC1